VNFCAFSKRHSFNEAEQARAMYDGLTSPPRANKLLGLEVLRFASTLSILFLHYLHFADAADRPVDLVKDRLPFYGLLHFFYESRPFGVWVFWCISGFIFFWKYRDAIAGRSMSGWTFFVLRLSRLYPLHLMTLLLVALLQPAYHGLSGHFFVYQDNDIRHFLLQIFLASNWGFQLHDFSFNGPIWSISVEVLVYAAFFPLLLATRSAWLNVFVVATCLNASGYIPACFAFFYIGGLAAIARRAVAPVTSGLALEGVAWLAVVALPLWAWSLARDKMELLDFHLLLIYMPILLFCLSREITVPASIQNVVEAAGNMTYSSYLLHFPIQLVIVLGFAMASAPIPFYEETFFGVFIATTLLASYVTYHRFEAPAQNLIRNLLLRPKSTGAESAPRLTR
jgi:peptidoglycan/LPS O-acetylase OafA/YrhL